jgi:hypothetical protein
MGLNNIAEWLDQLERRKQLQREVMDGEFIELRKAGFAYPRIIGTVADVLKERREAEFQKLLEKTKKNSVEISVEVAKAVSRTLPLRSQRVEVVKSAENVEKPLILELPKIALHGENSVLRKLMNWRVLRGLLVENVG